MLDKHGKVIAGNKTLEVAGSIGMEDVIIVHSDGTKLIAVQRDDLDLGELPARELAVYDNRVSEISLKWDAENLLPLMAASEEVEHLFTPGEAALLAAQVDKVTFQVIPMMFAPDDMAEFQAAWAEIEKTMAGFTGQPEWWVARMKDYDRIMGGISEVMAEGSDKANNRSSGKQIKYVHQALLYLLRFWQKNHVAVAAQIAEGKVQA